MQAYSNPNRANDAYSLPDVEVFQLTAAECAAMDEELVYLSGFGPFKTQAEALADAQENADPEDEELDGDVSEEDEDL
jgi:hypothetical protein